MWYHSRTIGTEYSALYQRRLADRAAQCSKKATAVSWDFVSVDHNFVRGCRPSRPRIKVRIDTESINNSRKIGQVFSCQ
jgi:hypothetical protein